MAWAGDDLPIIRGRDAMKWFVFYEDRDNDACNVGAFELRSEAERFLAEIAEGEGDVIVRAVVYGSEYVSKQQTTVTLFQK